MANIPAEYAPSSAVPRIQAYSQRTGSSFVLEKIESINLAWKKSDLDQ